MSYDIALMPSTHDLAIGSNGDLWLLEDSDRVTQQIKVTLLTLLGEWFLDTDFGVPYLEEIMIKNPKLAAVTSILRQRILDVPDVTRVPTLLLDFSRVQRTLSVVFEAETNVGRIGPHNVALTLRGMNG